MRGWLTMRFSVRSAVFLILFLSLGCQPEKPAPGVLARIDDTLITLEDFNNKYEEMKLENQFSPGGHEALMQMKTELLNQLIEEVLILKVAQRQGLSVTDEEMERQIMDTKEDYKGESLREYLNRQGLSFEVWKERVGQKLLIEKTIRTNCHYEEPVGIEEVRAYYDTHHDEYFLPERVKARQIVVASTMKAARVLQELKEGRPFDELAAENSLGPEGRFGGDLGYFARGDMPEEFNVVFSMKRGDISEPIYSPYGYHIFEVEDKKPERQITFDEVVDDIKRKIMQKRSEERYYQWLEELKEKAEIEINTHLLEYTH
jgi:parvulin-like peptidyl-prolyl isomerase